MVLYNVAYLTKKLGVRFINSSKANTGNNKGKDDFGWFITGFTDADGNFSILLRDNETLTLSFNLSQANTIENFELLKKINIFFKNSGSFSLINNSKTIKLTFSSAKALSLIIEHFSVLYPLQSTKKYYYLLWLESYNNKTNLELIKRNISLLPRGKDNNQKSLINYSSTTN